MNHFIATFTFFGDVDLGCPSSNLYQIWKLGQSFLRLNQELNGCSCQMQHVAGVVLWDIYNLRTLPVTGKPVANRWNAAFQRGSNTAHVRLT